MPLVRDDAVLVSFELTDGYTPAVKDAVHSGLKTTFTYEIELRQDVPAWVDRTIATSVVTNSVRVRQPDPPRDADADARRPPRFHRDDGKRRRHPAVDDDVPEDAPVQDGGTGTEPRVLRARARDGAAGQRLDAVAVGQRHLGHHEIHVPSVVNSQLPTSNSQGRLESR